MLLLFGVVAVFGIVGGLYWLPIRYPRTVGLSRLKRSLSRNGTDWRQIPVECLRAFVDDALEKATRVAGSQTMPRLAAFNRALNVNAYVVSALVRGVRAAEIMSTARKGVEASLTASLGRGSNMEEAKRLASATPHGVFLRDANEKWEPSDPAAAFDSPSDASRSTVDTGAAWAVHVQTLRQYGLIP